MNMILNRQGAKRAGFPSSRNLALLAVNFFLLRVPRDVL
jgi:hypothetical protein